MSANDQSRGGGVPRAISQRESPGRILRGQVAVLALVVCCAATLRAQASARGNDELQVGDRIVLRVEGEPQLTDTFTVGRGPALVLPIVGTLTLAGVRRDSIEKVLFDVVARYYRNPTVHARVLVRVLVQGEVAKPGFYSVPIDALVPDVLMAAGGPTPAAQIDHIRLTRLGTELMSRDSIQRVIAEGRSLSQLDIRSEDQFLVPRVAESNHALQTVSLWLTIPMAIATLIYFTRR